MNRRDPAWKTRLCHDAAAGRGEKVTNIVKSDFDWALFILTALTFALAVTRTVSLWFS